MCAKHVVALCDRHCCSLFILNMFMDIRILFYIQIVYLSSEHFAWYLKKYVVHLSSYTLEFANFSIWTLPTQKGVMFLVCIVQYARLFIDKKREKEKTRIHWNKYIRLPKSLRRRISQVHYQICYVLISVNYDEEIRNEETLSAPRFWSRKLYLTTT